MNAPLFDSPIHQSTMKIFLICSFIEVELGDKEFFGQHHKTVLLKMRSNLEWQKFAIYFSENS